MVVFMLHMDSTKTDKLGNGSIVTVCTPYERSSFSILRILQLYIRLLKQAGISSHYMFPTLKKSDKGQKRISTATIRKNNQNKYHLATGRDPKEIGAHSGRSGFVTDAIAAGIPVDLIKRTGRWKSDCWRIYYHDEQYAQAKATAMMNDFFTSLDSYKK